MSKNKKGFPFFIVFGAIVILLGLSIVPWGKLTGNRIKDFNLLSDLFPGTVTNVATESIDPELAKAMAEENAADVMREEDDSLKIVRSVIVEGRDSISLHEVIDPKEASPNIGADGTVLIEDYTVSGKGLKNMKRAIKDVKKRPVRIAVIGDSYIEGDILTMNIREMLQDRYGGSGVGYMPASSELTGFRTTVRQSCSGWTKHEIRQNMRADTRILPGEYFTSQGGKSTYKGVSTLNNLDAWNSTTVLALAKSGGNIVLTTDSVSETLNLEPTDSVQALTITDPTTMASIKASYGVEILGMFLNDSIGICVDNMSLRGNSGQTHRKLSAQRAAQMRPFVDYDLIVVEYGINALSSQQKDYSAYKKLIMQTISRLRECYPDADILVMGIGDRGQKSGSVVKSVPTSSFMVDAQRDAARQTGVLFWDTRQAMGGEDAVLEWRANGLINPDYIHLNHKGGKALAELFVKALVAEIEN